MKAGVFLWGTAWMPQVGHGAPDPYSHQFPPETYAATLLDLLEWSKLADQAGFDSFWVTEHHFQREGYQVVPNVLMLSTVMAQYTRHLKFGAMVHPIPTWHPLRFAEDFAIADILTGGRLIFGAGRGSVDREARVFGSAVSRAEDQANARNRKLFEEQMQIIKLAWSGQPFTHRGAAYRIPPDGLTATGTADGAPFDKLTVIPAPIHPVQIWQALNSKDTAADPEEWRKPRCPRRAATRRARLHPNQR
jgi:alkanesulfonate monooxygenase SsuD/methylene tetrahydromethanopterin reductase-like flavin-dependent oxidoreductase (luciferase family)